MEFTPFIDTAKTFVKSIHILNLTFDVSRIYTINQIKIAIASPAPKHRTVLYASGNTDGLFLTRISESR